MSSNKSPCLQRNSAESAGCPIKATRALRARAMGWVGIYYVLGCRNYVTVKEPARWFCVEADAEAAGFRKAWAC